MHFTPMVLLASALSVPCDPLEAEYPLGAGTPPRTSPVLAPPRVTFFLQRVTSIFPLHQNTGVLNGIPQSLWDTAPVQQGQMDRL